MDKYILALDQGTTSCRAILFDKKGKIKGVSAKEFTQYFPIPGWVEHDAMEILSCQIEVAKDVIARSEISADQIDSIGITNQRETVVLWDKDTGKPIYNAIVWQCRRTAMLCEDIRDKGYAPIIRDKTGLELDAYFSATKICWLLNQIPGARAMADKGQILAGTMDTWLIWNLTNRAVHATDMTNAARTMLYNIHSLEWDEDICEELEIPLNILPEVKNSSDDFGITDDNLFGSHIKIRSAAGDQQAALFGQLCRHTGMVKNTYGTGCFLLMNTGSKPMESKNKLLTTIAWSIGGKVEYALEGSIFSAGSAVKWLRDEMKIIDSAEQSEEIAMSVSDNGGVVVVPAFTGLGAPWWDMYARGTILGLTRGTGRAHIVRATLESIAWQTKDVLNAMEQDTGIKLKELRVDGGASANNFLMQFQADILGVSVIRPKNIETTALGAAYLAGLATGFWHDIDEIAAISDMDRCFKPKSDTAKIEIMYKRWHKAVERACDWEDHN